MGWLPSSILPREARFSNVTFDFRFAVIYVPFGDVTDARNTPGLRNTYTNELRSCHECLRSCRSDKGGYGFLVCRATNEHWAAAAAGKTALPDPSFLSIPDEDAHARCPGGRGLAVRGLCG